MDNVETMIMQDGYLSENRLRKRWLIAQMMHEAHYEKVSWWAEFVECKPYRYQWETLLRELKRIRKMKKSLLTISATENVPTDMVKMLEDDIRISEQFFNRKLAEKMLTQYLTKDLPENAWRYQCTTVYRKKENDRSINTVIMDIHAFVRRMLNEQNDNVFIDMLKDFVKNMIVVPSTIEKSGDWALAFEQNGAYFTMRDLIKYHGCRFEDDKEANADTALKQLNNVPFEQLFKTMNKMIIDNNCSLDTICAKMA